MSRRRLFTTRGVMAIKFLYEGGASLREIARMYDVSVGTIHNLLSGVTYDGIGKTELRPPKGAPSKEKP